MERGFSLASVVISYFLVAGGIALGLIGFAVLERPEEAFLFTAFAAGGFIGGFIAGRASRGTTIVEPAIGSILVIGSVVALIASTPIGKIVWAGASEHATRFIALAGGAAAVGALLGAFLSEKLLGEATRSGIPWILYTALATAGACFVAYLAAGAFVLRDLDFERITSDETAHKFVIAFFVAIGAGCLFSGLAVGASSRVRALIASALGAAGGVMGFFYLAILMAPSGGQSRDDAIVGAAIIAAAGGIVTFAGNAMGWGLFGRRG